MLDSTSAMVAPHPAVTNQAAFNDRFLTLTGVDLNLEEFALPHHPRLVVLAFFAGNDIFEAEALDHHPEWFNVYKTVEVTLSTHDAGGVTELDIKLATEMDKLAGG